MLNIKINMLPDSYFLPKSMICCARLIVKLLLQYIITFIILNKTRLANFYSTYLINKTLVAHRGLWPSGRGKVSPAVSYLPTGLARCSVGSGISCGVRKLTRTPRVTKKKKTPCSKLLLNITLHFIILSLTNCRPIT
jgi:hypothetical protein